MTTLQALATATDIITANADVPYPPCEVDVHLGCPLAEKDHAESPRTYAHTYHVNRIICVARAFKGLGDEHKLGIMLHEFGHLYGGRPESAADAWVSDELGIDIDYVDTVQWVDLMGE